MDLPLIVTLVIALGAGAIFSWIIYQARTPKSDNWHRNNDAIAKDRPSFDVYSAKRQRSLRLDAANKR